MNSVSLQQRCAQLIAQLSDQFGWQLAAAEQSAYTSAILALEIRTQAVDDEQLRTVISYYHSEHAFVEALSTGEHPDYAAAWEAMSIQVRRILVSRALGVTARDTLLSVDDLAQEVLYDIMRGLRQFRYQSRLQTWVFTLTSRCVQRLSRTASAQKRGAHQAAESLEQLREQHGDSIAADSDASPEEAAELHALLALFDHILARHPDKRLGQILRLSLFDDLSMRAIGERLELSVGRIHSLVQKAQRLLRDNPEMRAWMLAYDQSAEQTVLSKQKNSD